MLHFHDQGLLHATGRHRHFASAPDDRLDAQVGPSRSTLPPSCSPTWSRRLSPLRPGETAPSQTYLFGLGDTLKAILQLVEVDGVYSSRPQSSRNSLHSAGIVLAVLSREDEHHPACLHFPPAVPALEMTDGPATIHFNRWVAWLHGVIAISTPIAERKPSSAGHCRGYQRSGLRPQTTFPNPLDS